MTTATRDLNKCDVCGADLGPDRLHVLIDNGVVMRHTYCCRRHRYVAVRFAGTLQVQQRTDPEIESLAFAFRVGELQKGWE